VRQLTTPAPNRNVRQSLEVRARQASKGDDFAVAEGARVGEGVAEELSEAAAALGETHSSQGFVAVSDFMVFYGHGHDCGVVLAA
jgi:hypothetical protein